MAAGLSILLFLKCPGLTPWWTDGLMKRWRYYWQQRPLKVSHILWVSARHF